MKDICPECSTEVRPWDINCPACGAQLEAPNVQAARQPDEREALGRRFLSAEQAAEANGCRDVFDHFTKALQSSRAVLCRNVSETKALLYSDDAMLATFYELVKAGARRPEDAEMERLRRRADVVLFTYYEDHVHFAALSLDGQGAQSWGECAMAFKDEMISRRASALEENCVYFCKKWIKDFKSDAPLGYRAPWEDRHRLAVAKLGNRLKPDTSPGEYAGILISAGAKPFQEDFVEVHIFGPIHRRTVESIVMKQPRRKPDQLILKDLGRKLKEDKVDISVKTTT